MLNREEYVEQAYFFRTLRERMQQDMSTQDLLGAIRHEVLTTTMLPFALDFMAGELRLTGGFATAIVSNAVPAGAANTVMLPPAPLTTFSLNVMLRLAPATTLVAPLAGNGDSWLDMLSVDPLAWLSSLRMT